MPLSRSEEGAALIASIGRQASATQLRMWVSFEMVRFLSRLCDCSVRICKAVHLRRSGCSRTSIAPAKSSPSSFLITSICIGDSFFVIVTDLLVHCRADRALVAEVGSSHASRRPARHLHQSQLANRFGNKASGK